MKVKLHIERLVLNGLPVSSNQGPLVQRAVEHELARLLAAGSLARSLEVSGAVADLPAASLAMANGADAGQLGSAIARSIYKGIGR